MIIFMTMSFRYSGWDYFLDPDSDFPNPGLQWWDSFSEPWLAGLSLFS
jgi:hypothetical protein